jgi:hypothetical protein
MALKILLEFRTALRVCPKCSNSLVKDSRPAFVRGTGRPDTAGRALGPTRQAAVGAGSLRLTQYLSR